MCSPAIILRPLQSGIITCFAQVAKMPIEASISAFTCLSATGNCIRDQNPWLFALYHKVQYVFAAIEGVIAFLEVGMIIGILEHQFSLFDYPRLLDYSSVLGGLATYGTSAGVIGAWALVAYSIVCYINSTLLDEKLVLELQNQIPLSNRPHQSVALSNETELQCLYAARIISSVVLTILSAYQPILCAINVACLGYSLWKVSHQKWVDFHQTFSGSNTNIRPVKRFGQVVTGVSARYHFPIIPDRREVQDDCPICIENSNPPVNPKVYFCPDKSYHLKCLPPLFFSKSPHLLTGWDYTRLRTIDDNVETVTYPSSIPRSNLPECPDCRRNPTVDHQLYFTVTDRIKGSCESGLVTLRDSPQAIPA
jgi:hypothetical protein